MNFKEFLIESNVKIVLSDIVKIFDEVLKKYTDQYEVRPHYVDSDGVTIQFWRSAKHARADIQMPAQTLGVFLMLDHAGKYDLHLYNVYVPEVIRGKGYLTEVLTKVRKLPALSGWCKYYRLEEDN